MGVSFFLVLPLLSFNSSFNLTTVVLCSFYCRSLPTFWWPKSCKKPRHTGSPVCLFFVHKRSWLKRLFCCYTRPQNAHLRLVNCAFSGFASLKIALFIQLLTSEGVPLILFGSPSCNAMCGNISPSFVMHIK